MALCQLQTRRIGAPSYILREDTRCMLLTILQGRLSAILGARRVRSMAFIAHVNRYHRDSRILGNQIRSPLASSPVTCPLVGASKETVGMVNKSKKTEVCNCGQILEVGDSQVLDSFRYTMIDDVNQNIMRDAWLTRAINQACSMKKTLTMTGKCFGFLFGK